jgi:hypothetical protein
MSRWVVVVSRCLIAVLIVCAARVFAGQTSFVTAQPRGGQQEGDRDQAAYFRDPENDAANCLYLQLRLLGYMESYETFRNQLPDKPRSLSLASLANLGQKLGFPLVPVKMNMSELTKAGTPVIVYCEANGIGRGSFLLFLGVNENETSVALINGAYVTREWMSRDQFRRNWTGYALIAHPSIAWELWIRRSATVLVVAGMGICLARWPRNRAADWCRSLRMKAGSGH